MRNKVNRLFSWGTSKLNSDLQNRKIVLSNFIALLVGTVTIPFIYIFYASNAGPLVYTTIGVVLVFYSVIAFNFWGKSSIGRHLFLLTWNFGNLIYTQYLGKETAIQNCFFVTLALPYILFSPTEVRSKLFQIAIPTIFYFIIEFDFISTSNELYLSDGDTKLIRALVNPTIFVQIVAILWYYGDQERRLVKSNKATETLNKKLAVEQSQLEVVKARLERSQEELQGILTAIDDVVLVVDEFGEIQRFWSLENKRNVKVGNKIEDHFGLFISKKVEAAFDFFGSDYHKKIHESKHEGTYFQFKITPLTNIIEDKNLAAVLIRDVSQNKKVLEEYQAIKQEKEIAVKSAEFKESFLANMSHEIRTPLNGVVGVIDLLGDTPLTAIQRDYLQILKGSSDNLLTLINDILDLSKIEAGKMSLEPKRTNIYRLIDGSIELFKPMAKSAGLKLGVKMDYELPKFIMVDPSRLSQVLNNLISNAIKFTAEGGVTIGCKIVGTHKLEFRVEDTGEGIPKEQIGGLFEKFTQLGGQKNTSIKGTGLGLSIVKRLSELMGDGIQVESEFGKGSCFIFTVNFEETYQEEVDYKPKEAVYIKKSARVLLVDDIAVNRKVASIMLKKMDCIVTEATGGKEAVKIFGEEPFDVVLMDIQMPEMDGIEAMQKIRNDFKEVPPIVALSANALEGDDAKYIEKGFDGYMAKPITTDSLKRFLAQYL